jgi:hypothetical protein
LCPCNLTTGVYASGQDEIVYGSFVSTENKVDVEIDMAKNDNYYWAKKGTLNIKLVPPTGVGINYINLGAGYGHKMLVGNISISVSSGLSVSFSPSLVITKSGEGSGRVYSSGTVVNY